jgi:SAM-dependent methyltransferase
MIIHKLISRHLKHKDDPGFYSMQAEDAIVWLEKKRVIMDSSTKVLDLGCGHGIFGAQLLKKGCHVEFADENNCLMIGTKNATFRQINIDKERIEALGKYDVVICSNVLEHLSNPQRLIGAIPSLLNPNGVCYLSWTNWLSPWGGHEFSPFHYLGSKRGHLVFDRLSNRKRIHTPFVNLFPISINRGLQLIQHQPKLRIAAAAARYYPEFSFILRIPVLREFLTWNCALLITQSKTIEHTKDT